MSTIRMALVVEDKNSYDETLEVIDVLALQQVAPSVYLLKTKSTFAAKEAGTYFSPSELQAIVDNILELMKPH